MDSSCRKWPSVLILLSSERWTMGALYVVVGTLVIFGNIMIIAAVFSKRSLRTRSNLLLINLCFADLAVGCLALPLAAIGMLAEVKSRSTCPLEKAVGLVICLSCAASIFLLTLIAFDRYVKIVRFDSYSKIMRPTKIVFLVILSWVAAAGLGYLFISSVPQLYVDITLVVVTVACFTMIAIFYSRIFRAVAAQAMVIETWRNQDVQKSETSLNGNETDRDSSKDFSGRWSLPRKRWGQENKQNRKRSLKSSIVVAKTFIIIMAAFLLCWLPFMTVLLLRSFIPNVQEQHIYASFYHWSLFVSLCNSFVNPVIYNIKNRKIRSQIRNILRFSNAVRNHSIKSDREDN